jgi:hypothetical protein
VGRTFASTRLGAPRPDNWARSRYGSAAKLFILVATGKGRTAAGSVLHRVAEQSRDPTTPSSRVAAWTPRYSGIKRKRLSGDRLSLDSSVEKRLNNCVYVSRDTVTIKRLANVFSLQLEPDPW